MQAEKESTLVSLEKQALLWDRRVRKAARLKTSRVVAEGAAAYASERAAIAARTERMRQLVRDRAHACSRERQRELAPGRLHRRSREQARERRRADGEQDGSDGEHDELLDEGKTALSGVFHVRDS